MTTHKLLSAWAKRSGVASAGVAAVLMLSACAGNAPADPGPESSPPTASATASPTATPTPTPSAVYKPADASGPAQNVPVPVLPEVAKTETKEGLEAFTRYWFEHLNYAYQTGEVSTVQSHTAPGCQYCNNITGSLTTNYQEGRWLAGGRITLPAATTTFEKSSDGNYQVILQVLQDTITYYQPGGSEFRQATKPSNTGNVLLVAFEGSGWRVNGLHPLR
ncbi:hypothetical protein FJ661_15515 [Pseudarthrobacter phenanthrenivorans]|uniref:DUF6318 family protein n=1 Tax=Pseudarthrobacter phenanthrenivorans TaxID=361575 RepID=UPI00112CAE0C|nr:DUF6318 family protein [Pseudarthrobacter phenanthrenivorans]TPV49355.1 hypothetical protein FJ661_15515 [Pseudarthrobacter phenanthrenivorans]